MCGKPWTAAIPISPFLHILHEIMVRVGRTVNRSVHTLWRWGYADQQQPYSSAVKARPTQTTPPVIVIAHQVVSDVTDTALPRGRNRLI